MNRPPAVPVAGAFAAGAGVGALVLTARPAEWAGPVALVAGALLLAGALAVRRPVPLLSAAACLLGVARAAAIGGDPGEPGRAAALAGRQAVLVGRAVDDIRTTAGGFEVLVEPDGLTTGAGAAPRVGRVMVAVRGPGEVLPGDRVEASGALSLPPVTQAFDRRAYLAQKRAYLEMHVARIDVLEATDPVPAFPARVAALYRRGFESLLPPPHAALVMGAVLGIRTGTPPRLRQALIDTGLVHLLVLSGLKVAVFARLTAAALRPLLGRSAELAVIPLLALYALAGGSTAAAVRSAAMGALSLLGGRLGRPAHVWTSLALCAAAMLGWRPELVADVGFQLSFAGTAAIVLLARPIEDRLRRVPRVLREPFAVTVAAQVGTVPLMATDFHVLSPVGPIANAVALPVLPLLVGSGLVLAPLAAVVDPVWLRPPAAALLAAPAAWIEQVATVLAAAPAAAIAVPAMPPAAAAAYYGAVAGGIAALRSRGGRRLAAIAAALLLPVGATGFELVQWATPAAQATVLDVGDGTAILVTGPAGRLLLGGGPSAARLADGLGSRTPPWSDRLDAVAVTGAGLRRAGGLAGAGRAAAVWLPDADLPGSGWRNAALELMAGGAALSRHAAGDRLRVAGLDVLVLWPPRGWGDQASAALGLRIAGPHSSLCDVGDVDAEIQVAEARLLREGCDVLVLPNGGRTAPAPELLAAARPRTLVATAGGARLAAGLPLAQLRRTDQEGSLDFRL